MKQKKFFQERTPAQIRRMNSNVVNSQNDLVHIINELDSSTESIEIRTQIIPGKFRRGGLTGAESSRKCYKKGDLIQLPQEKTLYETLDSNKIPLDLRNEAFSKIEEKKENEINYVGYSWYPVFGRDQLKRVVNFVDIVEGARIFSYAENYSKFKKDGIESFGIKVDSYPDSRRVIKEGSSVVVSVPSRTEKSQKYQFGFSHVPYIMNHPGQKNFNLAISLSLRPSSLIDIETNEPIKGTTEYQNYDISYRDINSIQNSSQVRFSPQNIAGYLGIIKEQLTQEQNITALTYNPFSLPSRHQAEFYNKLNNNVLIYDPSISSENNKQKLRKLHLAEKSILLSRAISRFGHSDFSFWDPVRDKKFKDYNWS